MENPTRFDLNESIRQWRMDLAEAPAFRPEDMEELESHLRDSISALEAKGLSAHEAFWVAKNRIGAASSLHFEFSKVNVTELWLNRALWMVIGSIAISALSSIADLANLFTTVGLHMIAGSERLLGPTSLIVYLVTLAGLYSWAWRQGTRSDGLIWRLGCWMKARPRNTVLSALLIVFIRSAIGIPSALLVKTMGTSAVTAVIMWQLPARLLPLFIWPLVLGYLLARRTRQTAE